MIFEYAISGPLHANKLGGKNCEARVPGAQDGSRIGNRIKFARKVRRRDVRVGGRQSSLSYHEQTQKNRA